MKAMVRTQYGPPDVLHLADVERPTPTDNEVLVEIRAASINKADLFELEAPFPMRLLTGSVRKPKQQMLGADVAGVAAEVGRNVKGFKPGDEVFGCAHHGYAEYACARDDLLVPKPANVTFEEAAAVPVAAITALQALRKGRVQSGQKVLIDGSSGGVGTFALQIARSLGAEVTAVCSTRNVANATKLGADHTVDYTKEDVTKNGKKYDLILSINGSRSLYSYRHSLVPGGVYLMVGGSKVLRQLLATLLLGPLLSRTGSRKMGFMGVAKLNRDDLLKLKELLESGKIKPIIDRTYPLAEAPEAFRKFEEGHTQGKLIVTVNRGRA